MAVLLVSGFEWWLWPYAVISFGIGFSVGGLIVVLAWWDALTPRGRIGVSVVFGLVAGLIGGIVRVTP